VASMMGEAMKYCYGSRICIDDPEGLGGDAVCMLTWEGSAE